MKTLLIYTLTILILSLTACSKDKIPGVYRIDIQQGNDITQDMINKLEPGMTKSQVSFVMGTPLIVDVFHPNRWDYLYSFQPGNGEREQRTITLYFDDEEMLESIQGDIRTVAREDLPQSERKDTNVVVPLSSQKTGLWATMKRSVGLGDEQQEIKELTSDEIPGENMSAEDETIRAEEAEAAVTPEFEQDPFEQ